MFEGSEVSLLATAYWKTDYGRLERLAAAQTGLQAVGNTLSLRAVSSTTFPSMPIDNVWDDTSAERIRRAEAVRRADDIRR